MSAIIHKFNGPSRKDTGRKDTGSQYKQLIEQIGSCLNKELSTLIGNMFDIADDMLFQLAENASSNEDQTEYFDTMRMLRVERKNIGQNFAANLKNYLSPANKQTTEELDLSNNELSLVDQDEMEEMVAVSAMHSKAMNLYGEAVNHLEARIEFMSIKSTTIFNKDALAPKNICESFKDALLDVELSTNNKLVLYKLFDQEVILHLEALYVNLNQLFIDQGILPQIKLGESFSNNAANVREEPPAAEELTDAVYTENPTYNPGQAPTYHNSYHNNAGQYNTNQSNAGQHNAGQYNNGAYSAENSNGAGFPEIGAAPAGAGPAMSAPEGSGVGSHPATGAYNESNRIVNQFIHGELTATGPGIPASFTTTNNAPASSGIQYYERGDVMAALSNLQHDIAQTDDPVEHINAADFKRALLTDMGSRSGGAVTKQVNLVDEKTIDFIEMLFDAIVEDSSISEAVTTLLLRLQIPVIKVAMLDDEFFVDGDHPCRTTLNLIAHLGRGLSSREDELFTKLNQQVETLLNNFDIDLDSFEQVATQLEIIEQEELEATAKKERTTQKNVLQTHAREVVLSELQFHVMNKTLPKEAQKLILKHWSTLMFHQYIKYGKNSDDWQQTTNTVKQLIRLLQPVESGQGHFQLSSEKDQLLDNIQNALLSTRQNPVEIETEINNTFLLFEDMLENSKFNQTGNETYFTAVDEDAGALGNDTDSDALILDEMPEIEIEKAVIDPMQEQVRISREKIALLPSEVRPGVWFRVYNGDDSPSRRIKLSVIIMEEAKLVFVDRIGVKVLEKDAAIFSEELASNLSQIIADHSAFDHALGMVINSLSNNN